MLSGAFCISSNEWWATRTSQSAMYCFQSNMSDFDRAHAIQTRLQDIFMHECNLNSYVSNEDLHLYM